MSGSESIKQLFEEIAASSNTKKLKKHLELIERRAKEVLRQHNTLNVHYDNYGVTQSPLAAASSFLFPLEVFQLLIKLGADPFFKPKPTSSSAMEILANNHFSSFTRGETEQLFEWLMKSQDSPVFTWEKLRSNKQLFDKFSKADLIPVKQYIDVLPIHVAIEAGRIDLVGDVISAAGSIQKAGDICRMSILHPAIIAVFKGQENSLEMLQYLLDMGANTQTPNSGNLSAIMQVILAQLLYVSGAKEEAVFDLVKLLLDRGATLDVINPYSGSTPLMAAALMGYLKLFHFLLEKADKSILNHRAQMNPHYLIFQLLGRLDTRFAVGDVLKLLPELKKKGLEFDKTISLNSPADPFGDKPRYTSGREVSAQNMSLLHCYVENLTKEIHDPFQSMDKHLEIIQSLVANGANPHAKATFKMTKNQMGDSTSGTQKTQFSIELTASEYARKIADQIINRDYNHSALHIQSCKDEQEFLKNISYTDKEEQLRLHQKFHQFRNLERVLLGKQALPYAGLPDTEKVTQLALQRQKSAVEPKPAKEKEVLDSTRCGSELVQARVVKNQENWRALKKSMVDHVKEADSLEEFLARIEQFKKPLQLHYTITTGAKGEAVSVGSALYRFFHFFDPHKFPSSWENLRKFGQDSYGVDINMPYDQRSACHI